MIYIYTYIHISILPYYIKELIIEWVFWLIHGVSTAPGSQVRPGGPSLASAACLLLQTCPGRPEGKYPWRFFEVSCHSKIRLPNDKTTNHFGIFWENDLECSGGVSISCCFHELQGNTTHVCNLIVRKNKHIGFGFERFVTVGVRMSCWQTVQWTCI